MGRSGIETKAGLSVAETRVRLRAQCTWVFASVMSLIIIKVVGLLLGLRVTGDDEILGLDSSQHGESGYNLEA